MAPDVQPDDLSLAEHHRRADEAVDAALAATAQHPYAVAQLEPVRRLLDSRPEDLRSIVIVLMDRATRAGSAPDAVRGVHPGMPGGWLAAQVLGAVGMRRPAFSRRDVTVLLDMVTGRLHDRSQVEWVLMSLVGQPVGAAERVVKAGGVGELEGPIRGLANALGNIRSYSVAQAARYRARLVALLATADNGATPASVDASIVAGGDTWGERWRPRLAQLVPDQRSLFIQLPLASGVVPSAAWQRKVDALVRGEGCVVMVRAMLNDALASSTTVPVSTFTYDGRTYSSSGPPVADANSVIVRGAIWAAAGSGEDWVPSLLTDLGLHFGTSGRGDNETRDQRLANTSAAALGTLPGPAAIAGLGRLKARVTNRNVSKQIAKALEAAAARSGVTPSELLELAVPTLSLGPDGRREIPVGDHVAVLAIEDDDASLTWRAPDGRVTARPPAAIANETAAIAKAKEEHKELRKALGVERGRVEDLFAEDREWSVADWRTRYLAHPLTGTIGRRLIWSFRDGDAIVTGIPSRDGDGLSGHDGQAVALGPDATVALWHPIEAEEALIDAWRTRILATEVRQPFKQAFREIYLLTPAEEATETYSNRFAGHILRYPQARALMTTRRWGSNFLGPFDGGQNAIAKRDFPSHGLRAEFWHDATEVDMRSEVQHCTTDQVRFVRLQPVEQPIPLRDVPPLVLSEAMRDVDLFVSVASIGADRNWQDGGRNRDAMLDPYWNRVWDDDLSPTTGVRRDALERMIPGLVIAGRLELGERWLEVRGDLRTYRIHLGSGNVLMAPSDTYLCIVPTRGGVGPELFLPFDDDPTLSIILSKAFMLANDARITDASIVSQIRRG